MHISSVALLVPEYDSGIAYYVGTLGFTLLEDTDLGEGKRWVRVGPPGGVTSLLLAKAKGDVQTAAIGSQAGGRVGFFLETDDFDRDYARFVEMGVAFLEEPRAETYAKVVVFSDPFGNRWDLLQPT